MAAFDPTVILARGCPMFFSFDGLDGVGKTTQINLFVEWLRAQGHAVLTCVDPGSTPLGEAIRGILLGAKEAEEPLAISLTSEMLLFMAARAQLVADVIRPAIKAGQIVVSDRYLLANVVYQGHAGGLDVDKIWQIGAAATAGLRPDLVFVLDMAPEAARARLDRPLDRMERRDADYRARLRHGFLTEAQRDPQHILIVDAAREVHAVQADIRAAAERLLRKGAL